MSKYLQISWGVSRGVETAGWNICRLYDTNSGKKYRTMGGGYDMTGTVFGRWLTANYREQLIDLFEQHADDVEDAGYCVKGFLKIPSMYGLTLSPKGDPNCDGGCGLSSMRSIAKAVGLDVQGTCDHRGDYIGFIVSETEQQIATSTEASTCSQ